MGLLSKCFLMNKGADCAFVPSRSCYWTLNIWVL